MDIGYTNFLIENLIPLPDEDYYLELQSHQKLYGLDDIEKLKKEEENKRKGKTGKDNVEKESEKEKEENDGKFKAFTGKGVSLEENYSNYYGGEEEIEDEEMKKAIQMSLEITMMDLEKLIPVEPSTNEDGYNIIFKINDLTLQRRFKAENTIGDLINYCKYNLKSFKNIELMENYPKKIYSNETQKIKESGIGKNQVLMVKQLI